ncbi:MAG: lanthionine synthetase, partial [Actinomycetia bacterium]|nr:lanthionine synthetase [Actinomycetes bacterium]
MLRGAGYRDVGERAWSWVLDQVREDEGPWLPETVPPEGTPGAGEGVPSGEMTKEHRDSLYSGIAGLAPALAEIAQYRELTAREQDLAGGIVARLTRQAEHTTEPSLYD